MPDHYMAQSANSKTPLNIEVFWEKPSHEPPLEWRKWINVFEAAVFAKDGGTFQRRNFVEVRRKSCQVH